MTRAPQRRGPTTTPAGSGDRSPWTVAVLVGLLLLSPMAGCLSDGDGRDVDLGSYEEARGVLGPTYAPEGSDSPVWLKLIDPLDTLEQERGQQRVVVLLFDADADRPIRDADVTLEAIHADSGQGTAPENHPEHSGHGVYRGATNFDRDGRWLVEIEAGLNTGGSVTYEIPVHVPS